MTMRRGFTLIELVVVIVILAVLAAVAVPKFIDMGRSARLASLATMVGALRAANENVRALCLLDATCHAQIDVDVHGATLAGQSTLMSYASLGAGYNTGGDNVDMWVNDSGFTVTLTAGGHLFSLDGSPDPMNCGVLYLWAYGTPAPHDPPITLRTSGC